jgi:hypothetical protein
VTDRAEVIAELRPSQERTAEGSELEQRLERLREQGELGRSPLPKTGWRWQVEGLGLPDGTAARETAGMSLVMGVSTKSH